MEVRVKEKGGGPLSKTPGLDSKPIFEQRTFDYRRRPDDVENHIQHKPQKEDPYQLLLKQQLPAIPVNLNVGIPTPNKPIFWKTGRGKQR